MEPRWGGWLGSGNSTTALKKGTALKEVKASKREWRAKKRRENITEQGLGVGGFEKNHLETRKKLDSSPTVSLKRKGKVSGSKKLRRHPGGRH